MALARVVGRFEQPVLNHIDSPPFVLPAVKGDPREMLTFGNEPRIVNRRRGRSAGAPRERANRGDDE